MTDGTNLSHDVTIPLHRPVEVTVDCHRTFSSIYHIYLTPTAGSPYFSATVSVGSTPARPQNVPYLHEIVASDVELKNNTQLEAACLLFL